MGKGKDKGNWNKGKDKGNWHKGKDNASESPSKRRKLSAMAGAIVAAEQRIRANMLPPCLCGRSRPSSSNTGCRTSSSWA